MPEQTENILTWEMLFKSGCIIYVRMHIPGFTYRLRASDLGLDNQEAVDKALSNAARAIDRSRLKTLTNRAYLARKIVEVSSIEFPIIDGGRFVPLRKKDEVIQELEKNVREFNEYRDNEFIPNYLAFIEEMRPKLTAAIAEIVTNQNLVKAAVDKIIKKCPSVEDLRYKITLTFRDFNIATPEENKSDARLLLKQEQDIKRTMTEMIESLRGEILEHVNNIQDFLNNPDKGKIGMKTVNATQRFLTEVKTRNIFNDPVINSKSDELMALLSRNVKEGDVIQEMKAKLGPIAEALEADTKTIVENAAMEFKMGARILK